MSNQLGLKGEEVLWHSLSLDKVFTLLSSSAQGLLVWLIALMGTIRGLVTLYLFLLMWHLSGNEIYARTLAFTLLVMSSLFYALNCKQMRFPIWHKRSWNNPFLVMALSAALLLQLAVIYVPFLQKALHTVPLNFLDWLMIILLAASLSLIVEVVKPIFAKIFSK